MKLAYFYDSNQKDLDFSNVKAESMHDAPWKYKTLHHFYYIFTPQIPSIVLHVQISNLYLFL